MYYVNRAFIFYKNIFLVYFHNLKHYSILFCQSISFNSHLFVYLAILLYRIRSLNEAKKTGFYIVQSIKKRTQKIIIICVVRQQSM